MRGAKVTDLDTKVTNFSTKVTDPSLRPRILDEPCGLLGTSQARVNIKKDLHVRHAAAAHSSAHGLEQHAGPNALRHHHGQGC